MNSGIYQIRCVTSGLRYIGSTSSFTKRRASHFSRLRTGKHPVRRLQELADQHGIEKIEFSILEQCEPPCLYARERHWIKSSKPELNTRTDAIGGRGCIGRHRINITLPMDVAEALSAAASLKGWDRSRLLEELAAAYLRRVKRSR